MRRILYVTSLGALLLLFLISAQGARADITSAHYKILSPTISPGGTGSSASYKVSGTEGEIAHSTSTSASYKVNLGFFSFPVVTPPVVSSVVGNADQRVDLSWTAAIPYLGYTVSNYTVGYSTSSGGPYTFVSAGNVLVKNITGLTDGTPYFFVVTVQDNASITIATSTEITATPVAPSLTFVVDSGTQTLPALTPGALTATSSILTVKTSNPTGFLTTLVRSTVAATMQLNTDSTVLIPDKTDWTAPAATTTTGPTTASTTQPLTLQFRLWQAFTDTPNYASAWWGADDTSAGALFAGIPSTTQSIANRSIAAPATTTMRVLYDLNVPVTQKNGTYSGGITYSVTTNP